LRGGHFLTTIFERIIYYENNSRAIYCKVQRYTVASNATTRRQIKRGLYIMNKLKFEGTFKVGDVIRAYDFEPMDGRGDSFIIGRVLEEKAEGIEYSAYVVEVTMSVRGGKVDDESKRLTANTGAVTYVPHEISFDDHDNRIVRVG
jgi:hypothetical protein